jgi:hypothetical protein
LLAFALTARIASNPNMATNVMAIHGNACLKKPPVVGESTP